MGTPAELSIAVLADGQEVAAAAGHGLVNVGANRRCCAVGVWQRAVRQLIFTLKEPVVVVVERCGH